MIELPPFSGDSQCPKCGSAVDKTYHPVGPPYLSAERCRAPKGTGAQEHMCRACRCGYAWAEKTLDNSRPEGS